MCVCFQCTWNMSSISFARHDHLINTQQNTSCFISLFYSGAWCDRFNFSNVRKLHDFSHLWKERTGDEGRGTFKDERIVFHSHTSIDTFHWKCNKSRWKHGWREWQHSNATMPEIHSQFEMHVITRNKQPYAWKTFTSIAFWNALKCVVHSFAPRFLSFFLLLLFSCCFVLFCVHFVALPCSVIKLYYERIKCWINAIEYCFRSWSVTVTICADWNEWAKNGKQRRQQQHKYIRSRIYIIVSVFELRMRFGYKSLFQPFIMNENGGSFLIVVLNRRNFVYIKTSQ